jgi:arylsulfatase A-like enzyme
VLVDVQWTDAANDRGWRGTTTDSGVAGHGSSSPFDIHNTLIAAGPAFKTQSTSDAPTGNIDIAPTVCHLLGVRPAETMQGRALTEILRDGPEPASLEVIKHVHTAETKIPGGRYMLELQKSQVGRTPYVDFTRTRRVRDAAAGTG